MYSVKAVSQATGISPETLRAWERRYAAVTPRRETNGRRAYSPDDLTRLRTLKKLSDLGHPIGKLATLPDTDLHGLLDSALQSDPSGQAAGSLVQRLLRTAVDYDEMACDETLGLALATLAPERLVGDVLGPALRDIGDMWHRGDANVAQEHLLSSRVRRLVLSVMNAYRHVQSGPTVVFATLNDEQHNVGTLLAAYLATVTGARGVYVESALPADELNRYADSVYAQAIAIGLMRTPVDNATITALNSVCAHANNRRETWIGGPGARQLDADKRLPASCSHVANITEVGTRIAALAD